jgi:SAM-dependent methyltransferase
MDRLKEQLRQLYSDSSKHASYQNIPAFVRNALGYQEVIDESWRGDTARYAYLLTALDLRPGQCVADVGANTGFFVLALAHRYPECQFVAYESHSNHVEFMRLIIDAFDLANVVVQETAVNLQRVDSLPQFDVILHLNVLHHAGYDFDGELVNAPEEVADYAASYLSRLAGKASRLAFQIGYNWGGDKTRSIVSPQDQMGMIAWLVHLLPRAYWQVDAMAFATRDEHNDIVYRDLPRNLVTASQQAGDAAELAQAVQAYQLDQFRGEFYRRPLVICYSVAPDRAVSLENRGAKP